MNKITIKNIKDYNRLQKYCTTTKVHGKLYKERLKELQKITLKLLIFEKEIKKWLKRKYRQ